MRQTSRLLLIDIGNTRIKWALAESGHDSPVWLAEGARHHEDLSGLHDTWNELPVPAKIIGCNVAGSQTSQDIEQYWSTRGVSLRWTLPATTSCGVRNLYDSPAQLGADRWAALVGAWQRSRHACIVVSAGTAVTIDSLSPAGEFIGGMILPGRQLMRQSLAGGTHALRLVDGEAKGFPRNTADAIASGIANGLAGAVERAHARLAASQACAPELVFTGGDGEWLSSQMAIRCTIAPRLILEGLFAMAVEETAG